MARSYRDEILVELGPKAEVMQKLIADTEIICKRQTPEARAAVIAAAQLLIKDIEPSVFDITFKPEDDWFGGSILHINSKLGFCQIHFKGDGTLKCVNTFMNSRIRGVFDTVIALKFALNRLYEVKS